MKNQTYYAIVASWQFVVGILCLVFASLDDSLWRVGYDLFDPVFESGCSAYQWYDIGFASLRGIGAASSLFASLVSWTCWYNGDPRTDPKRDRAVKLARFKFRKNARRWIGLGINWGAMVTVAVAILCGERSVFAFIQRGGCTIAMMVCAYLLEYMQQARWLGLWCYFGLCVFVQDMSLLGLDHPSPYAKGVVSMYYTFSILLFALGAFEYKATTRNGYSPITGIYLEYEWTDFYYICLLFVSQTVFSLLMCFITT